MSEILGKEKGGDDLYNVCIENMYDSKSKQTCIFVERRGFEVIISIIGWSDIVPCHQFYLISYSHNS